MQEIIINSKQSRVQARDAVMAITSEPLMVVAISEYSDDRSAAQNRLYWAWLKDCQDTTMNEYAGNFKDWWHDKFKRESLLNIFIADEKKQYAQTMAALAIVRNQVGEVEYEAMYEFVISKLSTTEASIKQFAEYLNAIEHWCHWHGILLRTDSLDYKRAMGKK